MKEDNIQELMKPRYKVIVDYPGEECFIGQILQECGKSYRDESGFQVNVEVDKYPHLFQKLQWWQDRDPKELVGGYAKSKEGGYVTKIHEPISKDGNWFVWDNLKNSVPFRDYVPATETEYTNYLNKNNQ